MKVEWWARPLWAARSAIVSPRVDSDAELLERWRDGDEEAASKLIRRHFSRVYGFFRSKLDDHVEDLTQRTFMACVEAKERLGPDTSFRAYVLGTARRQLPVGSFCRTYGHRTRPALALRTPLWYRHGRLRSLRALQQPGVCAYRGRRSDVWAGLRGTARMFR